MSYRVRIAPSPTGDPHVGTAYMAIFNAIFAKHHGGKFILRIEDTDQQRSRIEYEQKIYDALKWCQIRWDEGPDCGGEFGPYRQSERLDIYKKYAQQLVKEKKAYACFCTPEELAERRQAFANRCGRQGYDRRCRDLTEDEVNEKLQKKVPSVIRLKVPLQGECVYTDAIKGRLSCPWIDVDDQVLLKTDGFPTYHLANVVDDHLMQISHVIRGDEWISSTPKHILLYEFFNWKPPVFMHMPLLLGTDGKKLSKRKNPTSIFYYKESGFLPEAFDNFLTLMGYSMPGDLEMYSLDEIIASFDEKRIGVSSAIFDIKKLEWLNKQYIMKIPVEKLLDRLKQWRLNEGFLEKLMPLCHSRMKTFGDFLDLADFFFINHLKYHDQLFLIKDLTKDGAGAILQAIIWDLEEREDWSSNGIEKASHRVAEVFGVNHKKIVMPLLFAAIMGKKQGLPLFASVQILGKDLTRSRLINSIVFLGGISNKKMQLLRKAWDSGDCKSLLY